MKICSVEGCERDTRKGAKGLCGMHYLRLTRYGRLHSVVNRGSGRTVTNAGYVLIETTTEGRRYEHVILAEKALGKRLPKGAVVHHMNDKKWDNHTPLNLVICPDQTYHLLLHYRAKRLREDIETVKRDD